VDERHRSHAPDSIFGIYEPTTQLFIPFDLDGVITGFHTRLPTAPELEDIIDRHVELTSEVEWIPHSFATSLAEGDVNDNSEFLSSLRARHIRVIQSRTTKQEIRTIRECLCALQALPELQFVSAYLIFATVLSSIAHGLLHLLELIALPTYSAVPSRLLY
jgi:hypothetical protein